MIARRGGRRTGWWVPIMRGRKLSSPVYPEEVSVLALRCTYYLYVPICFHAIHYFSIFLFCSSVSHFLFLSFCFPFPCLFLLFIFFLFVSLFSYRVFISPLLFTFYPINTSYLPVFISYPSHSSPSTCYCLMTLRSEPVCLFGWTFVSLCVSIKDRFTNCRGRFLDPAQCLHCRPTSTIRLSLTSHAVCHIMRGTSSYFSTAVNRKYTRESKLIMASLSGKKTSKKLQQRVMIAALSSHDLIYCNEFYAFRCRISFRRQ